MTQQFMNSDHPTPFLPVERRPGGFKVLLREWIIPIVIALIVTLLVKTFVFQLFKIPSGSMEDTLLVGDQLVALKFVYGIPIPFSDERMLRFDEPEPGDVIVFKYPPQPSKDFIKRVVAVGGQTVEIKDGHVYVDGRESQIPIHAKNDASIDDMAPQKVPEDEFFVLGDNRGNSNDSRFWGTVPIDNIKGKAVLIHWSWNRDAGPLHKIRWGRLFRPIR